MMRLTSFFGFCNAVGNKTRTKAEITTSLHCHAESNDGEYDSTFESVPGNSKEDFEFVYDIIRQKIDIVRSSHPNIKVDITLTGMLNGEEVNKTFHDIEPYHQFLQDSLLIDTKKNPNLAAVIKPMK